MIKKSEYKKDFHIFNQKIEGKDLIYLDSAATTQKPYKVIDKMSEYLNENCASPNRGAYYLSEKSTLMYEEVRNDISKLINSKKSEEIIFTKNTTESLNIIAYSYGLNNLNKEDEIVVSILEHHSNIVPWQEVCKKTGAKLKFMQVDNRGQISEEEINEKITNKTKFVGVTHVSNALGTITNVEDVIKKAHEVGAKIVVDGAQAVPHMKIDVQKLDVDFYVFSGHKMLGPTGIGILYAKEEILNEMEPFLTGGDMIEYVTKEKTTFAKIPNKFEAGTQNVMGAIGLGEAIKYIQSIGYDKICEIEKNLTKYALEELSKLEYIEIYGGKDLSKKSSVIAFNIKDVHPHDVATILSKDGVCIRAGHHCTQPLAKFMGVNATCRVSFYLYNDKNDVDKFINSIKTVREWLKV